MAVRYKVTHPTAYAFMALFWITRIYNTTDLQRAPWTGSFFCLPLYHRNPVLPAYKV